MRTFPAPTRFRIIELLKQVGALSASDIAAELKMPRDTVIHSIMKGRSPKRPKVFYIKEYKRSDAKGGQAWIAQYAPGSHKDALPPEKESKSTVNARYRERNRAKIRAKNGTINPHHVNHWSHLLG